LLLHYWWDRHLGLLIHPTYNPLVAASGVVLVGLGLYRIVNLLQRPSLDPQRMAHVSVLFPPLAIFLLATTALLGYVLPPQPLSSQIALRRGAADNFTLARQPSQPFRISLNPKDRSLADWVRTLNAYPDPEAYAGQPAQIQEFVIRTQAELPDGMFLLAQFVIRCCAADAYPVTLPVRWTDTAQLEPDSWQEASGRMAVEPIEGRPQLVLVADSLRSIPTPEQPYTY
jgi:uncharacterized repeat protein (TIGR03943 family)